jgi:DNA-binding transcriptional MerR regulator
VEAWVVDGPQGAAGEPAAQDTLFPDSVLADPHGLTDQLLGYRGPAACQIAGITYRQLDYWARTSLVVPSIRGASGSGSQRLYSFKDILVLKVVKRLLDTGVSLQNIRVAVEHLRRRGVRDLARITLFSDGTTVYECTSPEEVVDLLQGGQGVFGIADGGHVATAPEDELTKRRRTRRIS